MQLALENHDILEDIFRQILPKIDTKSPAQVVTGRLTLARAARTCKAFNVPATNELWKFMDSLVPLFKLLRSARLENSSCVRRISSFQAFLIVMRP